MRHARDSRGAGSRPCGRGFWFIVVTVVALFVGPLGSSQAASELELSIGPRTWDSANGDPVIERLLK